MKGRKKFILARVVVLEALMEEVSVELHFQTQVDFQKEPVGKVEEF